MLGVVAGLAAAAVVEVSRPRGEPALLIDWEQVRRRAQQRLAGTARLSGAEAADLAAEYNRLAAELTEPLLALVGGLPEGASLPPFQALDRSSWVDLNVDIVARIMTPVLEANRMPASILLGASRSGMELYAGALLAFIAGRVLGQYDPQLMGAEPAAAADSGLYLVEPNIAAFQAEAGVDGDELRRWLILHELTHAWQFAANPWLRGHLDGMLQEVLDAASPKGRSTLERALSLTVGLPSQMAVMRRMQAAMSMVEGYGNLVMNRVGARLLPSFERLKEAYERRSRRRSPVETLFWKVTGLDLKSQQYTRGERFCQAVMDAHGVDAVNLAWRSPAHLPALAELDDPEAWYRRVSAISG